MPYVTTLSAPKFIGQPTLVIVYDEFDGYPVSRLQDLGLLTEFGETYVNGQAGHRAVLDNEREYFWPLSRPVVNFYKPGQATAVIALPHLTEQAPRTIIDAPYTEAELRVFKYYKESEQSS